MYNRAHCWNIILLVLLVALGTITVSECSAAPPRMRPYSGIGLLFLQVTVSAAEREEPLYLYQEPGIARIGAFTNSMLTGYQWLFEKKSGTTPLIVMARKGNWLKVCYDDAGREAWLDPGRRSTFQPWDPYLKRTVIHLLAGLRPQYYQLYLQPGQDPGGILTPRQQLRIVNLDDDWAMVLADQATIGWLRWRDEDGRLTIELH